MAGHGLWRAVSARDAAADGRFVFAVRTTGVYCRPSCPSRRPLRSNVTFFRTPAQAEHAGYRSCRRCRPAERRASLAERAARVIDAADDVAPSLAQLSRTLGVSPAHLQRAFKQALGVTPKQYTAARRLNRFKSSVKGGRNVTEALYEAGYGSSSRLYERSSERLGMTPRTYGRRGAGMRICYATVQSSLGRLLVAATDKGISSVCLGDSDGVLVAALRQEYSAAAIAPDRGRLARFTRAILRHLDGKQPRLDLPTDVRATAFQERVWAELRRIPFGATRSYADVARAIGRPRAVRAVARACATNPTAIVVPCHRVVRSGGDLGGYRWGVARKRQLLGAEAARAGR
jgi:AraC family transcriptional regulator of adaptative response/methylated-DNA-[protein]-cysteine methyltransferase